MPKLSRYNHFHLWQDGYYIAYNAASGAVALMTAENYEVYNQLAGKLGHNGSPLDPQEQDLLTQLQYGRFVGADEIDEWETLRFQHNSARYDRAALGLIIAPTLACNMACPYCYEANKSGRMSTQVIESIIAFVEKQAPTLATLDISWYGGEPLLAIDIVDDLTKTFLDLCREHKIGYGGSMITNGYLLTKEMTDRLIELKIGNIQVTIDGPSHLHNVKRPLKNGRDSFSTIIENLKYTSTKIGTGIRVNVDKSFTSAMIAELLDELTAADLCGKVGVYFGQIEPSVQACANISEACYETADFSTVEIEFYRVLLDKGYRIDRLPAPMATYCMAQSVNSFMIDPEGYLYRCFNHVGDKAKAMGKISDPIDYQNPNFTRLFRPDPFDRQDCRQCRFLPICMGGCPSRRVDRDLSDHEMCESWRHNLTPMLEIIAVSKQREMQQKQQAESSAKE